MNEWLHVWKKRTIEIMNEVISSSVTVRYDTIYLRAPRSWRISSLICHTEPNKKSNEATKNETTELLRRNGLFIKFMELSWGRKKVCVGNDLWRGRSWQGVKERGVYPSYAQGGGQNDPLLRFLMNYFLSYADTTDIFLVSVPKHQRFFLTYYTPIYPFTGQVCQVLEHIG